MDQIIIKDLRAHGIIGVNEWERTQPQDMLINVLLFTDLRNAAEFDDLNLSISYSEIARKLLAHAETARRFTLEALAADLANICLADPKIMKVRLRVEKPGAISRAASAGVEIERSRLSSS